MLCHFEMDKKEPAGGGSSAAAILKLSKLLSNQEKDREESMKGHKRILTSSSSSSMGAGAQIFSEESMMSGFRHEVEEDAQMSDSRGALSEDTVMTDITPQVHVDRDSFPRQSFKFAADDSDSNGKKKANPFTQRTERTRYNTMELSDYYSKLDHPKRVCIAENFKFHLKSIFNPKTGKEEVQRTDANGKPFPETLYKYHIYSRPSAFLSKVAMQSEETRYAFVIVEEGEPVFAYFDFDLGPEHRKPELHGESSINLLGYSLAMFRMVMSQILCINLLCVSDGVVIAESEQKKKWSNHAHIPWPFEERISLNDVMTKAQMRFSEVHAEGVKAVAPMFYTRFDKNANKEVEACVIDKNVYTKKRNFRVPYAMKAKDNSPILKPVPRLDLWNRPEDTEMCASQDLYQGLSAYMILCRNSLEFWTPHTVRTKDIFPVKGDVVLSSQDFQCLPVTGKVQTYKQLLNELGSPDNCTLDQDRRPATMVWGGRNTSPPVDSRIEKYIEKLFRLLYDENWADATRMGQSKGGEYQRIINKLYGVCRNSPLHTQALLVLIPHVYKTGMNLLQQFPRSAELTFDKVAEYAKIVGDVFARNGPCSEAFEHVWEFRSSVELAYSNTCTQAQRIKRAEYLHKLGGLAMPIFTDDYALRGGSYNASGCATDVIFIDMFITEMMLWSGQAIYVFQMDPETGGDDSKLLDVLPKNDSDYDELFKRCVYYTCHRLGRQVESPSRNTKARGPLCSPKRELPPLFEAMKKRAGAKGFTGPGIPFTTLKK